MQKHRYAKLLPDAAVIKIVAGIGVRSAIERRTPGLQSVRVCSQCGVVSNNTPVVDPQPLGL